MADNKLRKIRRLDPEDLNAVRHRGVYHVFPMSSQCMSYCGVLDRSNCSTLQKRASSAVKFLDMDELDDEFDRESKIGSYCKACFKSVRKRLVEKSDEEREMDLKLLRKY